MSKETTLEEVREAKKQLEHEIGKSINKFMNEYKLLINRFDTKVTTTEAIGGSKSYYTEVSLEIVL